MNILSESIINSTGSLSFTSFLACMTTALILGLILARVHMVDNIYSKGFIMSLALLPATVSVIIIMVNGNIGTGVAVAGAFSLVRFRSLPGTAREITSLFLAMAVGLATGMGFLGYATLFTLIIGLIQIVYSKSSFGQQQPNTKERRLRITVPESLNYDQSFDEIFNKFTEDHSLVSVKTTNMGSMYRLAYDLTLNNPNEERDLIDALRTRNGNLEVSSTMKNLITPEL